MNERRTNKSGMDDLIAAGEQVSGMELDDRARSVKILLQWAAKIQD